MAERTQFSLRQELLGAVWLGNATLDEYEVASWLEENDVKYIYLAAFGGFRDNFQVDFLITHTAPTLVLEVQGDKWHLGQAQRALDRARTIYIESQGAVVVEIWGHDIMKYPGYPMPTDESFDRVMREAMNYHQISHAAIE